MIFSAFFPLVELAIELISHEVEKFMDRGYTFNKFKTEQKSIYGYVNLYSGPNYDFHFRYSNLLLSVAITFMYGNALPILYPIAAINLFIMSIMDHLLVIFYYKEPPSYDETMTLRCFLLCRWSAMIGLAISFW